MTCVRPALLTLLGGACLAIGCGTTPRDVNFNTDAGKDFVPPIAEAGADTTGAAGSAGAGGVGSSGDADTDAVSDGGAG